MRKSDLKLSRLRSIGSQKFECIASKSFCLRCMCQGRPIHKIIQNSCIIKNIYKDVTHSLIYMFVNFGIHIWIKFGILRFIKKYDMYTSTNIHTYIRTDESKCCHVIARTSLSRSITLELSFSYLNFLVLIIRFFYH